MLRVATQSAEYSRLSYCIMYHSPDIVRDVRGFFMDRGLVVWKMAVEKGGLVKL